MHRMKLDPRIVVCVVHVSAMFMSIMDATIVNVALPSMSRQFHVSTSSIDAVVVAYLVSLAVTIPASRWIGDRWGTKRTFLLSLTCFALASALCGLAGSFTELVAARVLQGAAGGILTPVGMTMLFRTFPPEQRVRVSRILIIPTVIAPALGPVLGGLLVVNLSWRWVFFVNLPIAVIVLLFGLNFLPEYREPTVGRFDLPGLLLAGFGFALVMYATSEGSSHGWFAPDIVLCALVGGVFLVVLVLVELGLTDPIVDLRLFGNRLFRSTTLVSLLSGAGFSGVLFIVPLFLQEGRGASALTSGLATFPEALGVVLSAQLVGRLYAGVGPRRLMAGGLAGVAVVMVLLSQVGFGTDLWVVRILMFCTGAGMAYSFLPASAAGFATITPADMGHASALSSVQRYVGSSLGVALLSSVLATVGPTRRSGLGTVEPNLAAYHAAILAAALLALAGALLALTVPDQDAAATR